MNVQMVQTSSLKPYARNARVIPPEAVRKVAKSITEFGWRQPIVVDAGSHRHLWTHPAACGSADGTRARACSRR